MTSNIQRPQDIIRKSLDELADMLQDYTFGNIDGELLDSADHIIYEICEHLYDFELLRGERGDGPPRIEEEEKGRAVIAASIVPLSKRDNGFLDDFVNWTALYSELTVFVLPITISETYIGHSVQSHCRENWPNLEELINYNKRYEYLVKSGKGVFLPRENSYTYESMSEYEINRYLAPLVQEPNNYSFTPLNAKDNIFTCTSFQEFFILKEKALPYFKATRLDKLNKIVKNETEYLPKFSQYLIRKLEDIGRADSFARLLDILREIDYAVSTIEKEFRELSKLRVLKGQEIGQLAVSLSALILDDTDTVKPIAGILGCTHLTDIFDELMSYMGEKIYVKRSDCYVPYLLKTDNN